MIEVQLGTAAGTNHAVSDTRIQQDLPRPFESVLSGYLVNYEAAKAWRQQPPLGMPSRIPSDLHIETRSSSTPIYRIQIKESGVYSLTYGELSAADPSVNLTTVDPQNFHLTNQGQEVAIQVTGESDGSFDLGDRIYFFGQALDTVYADENTYWLTWNG